MIDTSASTNLNFPIFDTPKVRLNCRDCGKFFYRNPNSLMLMERPRCVSCEEEAYQTNRAAERVVLNLLRADRVGSHTYKTEHISGTDADVRLALFLDTLRPHQLRFTFVTSRSVGTFDEAYYTIIYPAEDIR